MKKLINKIAKENNLSKMKFTKKGKIKKKSREKFVNEVNWFYTPVYQKLSEDFIREFKDELDWGFISAYQKLSENFIREFKGKVDWDHISVCQKLSEGFVREFKNEVYWDLISYFQKLSESFIREFKNKVDWSRVSKYQKLSSDFRKEFKIDIPKDNWLYKSTKSKLEYIKENTDYELTNDDSAIIAYKSVRNDGHSVYNFQYLYETGKTYESHCDMNINNDNSFGLSSWTLKGAKNYHKKGKLFKVKVNIKDIGAIVHANQKIRSAKIEMLSEV